MSKRLGAVFSPDAPKQADPKSKVAVELHTQLIKALDLEAAEEMPRAELRDQLENSLTRMLAQRQVPMSADERRATIQAVLDEILGFGPLESLLQTDGINDILVNGPKEVYVEKKGVLEEVNTHFRDEAHLRAIIDRIVGLVGRRIDESTPMVDARLPDGSRFNAVIPPAAVDGSMVSIRRFGSSAITRDDLVGFGSLPEEMMQLLDGCVRSKLNLLISGGTGSGKTTLLNVLSSFIPHRERIITVEDAAELQLQQKHVVRLETRPENIEGRGIIRARDLVRNALRMRPDRIILGEIRGGEAVDMLQAMNTGHQGSLSTIHANSARHALARMQTLVTIAAQNLPPAAVREMIADALHVVVQISRLADGSRKVVSITEITGMEGGVLSTQEIFRFRQTNVEPDGRVRGHFEATGIRPMIAEHLGRFGIQIDRRWMELRVEV